MNYKFKKYNWLILGWFSLSISAQNTSWPQVKTEMKPAARWWWMGSAVDKENLRFNMSEYASKGLGGLEITPIYGVKGNDKNEIPYLSPKWMEMFQYTALEGKQLGIKVDMSNGTGWPFGGPKVSLENAATKVIFEEYTLNKGERLLKEIAASDEKQRPFATFNKLMAYSDKGQRLDLTSKVFNGKLDWKAPSGKWRLIAVFNGKTLQKVKRAAPGGEGYVMNHFSQKAVADYLDNFTQAFAQSSSSYPNSFFNDSYEVYGGDWTEDLFVEFEKRRGYKLQNYLPEFLSEDKSDTKSRIVSDYRETLGELLLQNFTRQWTSWAHTHGSTTRNQAHGSPANLIDIYAAVDIPESESFGISEFHIKGLRTDSIRKINDSDLSMLKYASSAAHITGKPYTSSETFTWLTEHFRTSLSQCKPDLDLLFQAGVNHVFFHGITYSPKEAAWPGWKFYASVDMSPTNSIWRDADAFFQYITRCQSFLQQGKPDNDFLLYFPVYDMWYEQGGRLLLFDIHKMQERAPKFISTVNSIIQSGYDLDYISDQYLLSTQFENQHLVTTGGAHYKAIIVPGVRFIPLPSLKHLMELAQKGATVVFLENYPNTVPGYANLDERQNELETYMKTVFKEFDFAQAKVQSYGLGKIVTGTDYKKTLAACGILSEPLRTEFNLHYVRRTNADGHHYFVSALKGEDTESWVTLAVNAESAMFFDPLTGKSGLARTRKVGGRLQVYLQLASGQSIFIKTFDKALAGTPDWHYIEPAGDPIVLDKSWKMKFVESEPAVAKEFSLDKLISWTDLGDEVLKKNKGTARYSLEVTIPEAQVRDWLLDLGDVRESARLRVNGKEVAVLWSVPFRTAIGEYLHSGKNLIEIDVTNLPANLIADYDRRKVVWRNFKEINFVKLGYESGDFSNWSPVPSGLLGEVKLIPLK